MCRVTIGIFLCEGAVEEGVGQGVRLGGGLFLNFKESLTTGSRRFLLWRRQKREIVFSETGSN